MGNDDKDWVDDDLIPELPGRRDVPVGRAYADEQLLRATVRRSKRKRRGAWLLVAAGALALTGAGVVRVVWAPRSVETTVRCYATTDVGRGDVFDGTTVAKPGDGKLLPLDDALGTCRTLWQQGVIGSDPTAVPVMVACVGTDGTAWVFPAKTQEFCDSHSLPRLTP